MASETADRAEGHRRSLKVTATATIGGVVAGLVTASVVAGPSDQLALAVFFGAIMAELGVMRLLGIDVSDFSLKDNLYVSFMTFALWFITWTVLLTTGTTPF